MGRLGFIKAPLLSQFPYALTTSLGLYQLNSWLLHPFQSGDGQDFQSLVYFILIFNCESTPELSKVSELSRVQNSRHIPAITGGSVWDPWIPLCGKMLPGFLPCR